MDLDDAVYDDGDELADDDFEDDNGLEEEDLNELVPSTYNEDVQKSLLVTECSFYKSMKLRLINNVMDYEAYEANNFYNLPERYPKKQKTFDFFQLTPLIRDRFVELLAPLTLYHFSMASKDAYRYCLNLRGLEFSSIIVADVYNTVHWRLRLNGFDGMRTGVIMDSSFSKMQTCFSRLELYFKGYLQCPEQMQFVKKYKMLNVYFEDDRCDDRMIAMFDAVFHDGVEHVRIVFSTIDLTKDDTDPGYILPFKYFAKIFNYCKNVESLFISLDEIATTMKFLEIKEVIESWAVTTTRLDFFIFECNGYQFQLHENKLKRCVDIDGKWYWSSRVDVDNEWYQCYLKDYHFSDEHEAYPKYVKYNFYEDIVGGKVKLPGSRKRGNSGI